VISTLVLLILIALLASDLVGDIWVRKYGELVQAKVTGIHQSRGARGGTSYSVTYDYDLHGYPSNGGSDISHEEYARLSPHQRVNVRVGFWFGSPRSAILLGAWDFWTAHDLEVFYLIAFCLAACFAVGRYLAKRRRRRILAMGTPTNATIAGKWKFAGIRGVQLAFQIPGHDGQSSTDLQTRTAVKSLEYLAVRAGDVVTVFYLPLHPRRFVVYDFCEFDIV
jgi:hypothetical protein